MNVSITIDDSGNPIFSQEGSIDFDSVIRDVLADKSEIKEVFSKKFKSLADSIKIDTDKISENVVKLFTFSSTFKKEVNDAFKDKISEILDGVSVSNTDIKKNIESLFEYKDKDKQLKNIFDKLNSSIPKSMGSSTNTEGGKGAKADKGKNIMTLDERASKNVGLLPVEIQNFSPNVFRPFILDINILDVDEGILSIITDKVSEAISQKNYDKLSPLFDNLNYTLENISLNKNTDNEESPIVPIAPTSKSPNEPEDTAFEKITPVMLMDIEPGLLQKLISATGGKDEGKEEKEKNGEKGGGVLSGLGSVLGVSGAFATLGALKNGIISTITSIFKLPGTLLKYAANPITLILAGVVWGIVDGVKATFKAEEWGTSKLSAGLGGFLAGSTGGLFANMGKWALMGAGVGSLILPFIGTVVGGLVGAIVGAIFNVIGAEKIAQKFDALAVWFDEHFGGFVDSIGSVFNAVFDELSYTWDQVKLWFDEKLMPAVEKFKTDLEPIIQRISVFINEKLIPDIKRYMEFISPVFETINNAIKEYIWPGIELIGSFLGDALVGIFNNLGPVINSVLDGIGLAYDAIVWGIETIGKMFTFVADKIEGIVNFGKKAWDWVTGDDRSDEQKRLDKLQDDLEKNQKELVADRAKLEKNIKSGNERRIADARARLKQREDEIQKLSDEQDMLYDQMGLTQTASESARRDLNKPPIKTQDAVVDFLRNAKSKIQLQLDGKDKLETYNDSGIFSKQGGTLDNAINELTKKVDMQIKVFDDKLSNLNSMFSNYTEMFVTYNEQLIANNSGSKEPSYPAEQSIPQGYIRDPNYEFRMRLREIT